MLRAYLREPEIDERTPPHYRLRAQLVQTIAAVQLLIAGWCEPPEAGALHLSTLVQQVLSTIAQHGGARADQMWRALCREGAFRAVDSSIFADLLRSLAATELIRQLHTGEVVLDLAGERIVNHYSFYSAFQTTEEYRLTSGGRNLGTLPISYPLFPGLYVIFGGRRWEVLEVDQERKTVDLKPAQGGRLPAFEGGRGAPVHERVRKEMLALYQSGAVPPFLDARARELLAEGRSHFARLGLDGQRLIPDFQGAILFGWQGDRVMDTLLVWLSARGLKVAQDGLALLFPNAGPLEVRRELAAMASSEPPEARELAVSVVNKRTEKFHPYLSDPLLELDYASSRLEVKGAWVLAGEVAEEG